MKTQIKTILSQTNDVVQSIDRDARTKIMIKQDDDILSIHIETTGYDQIKKHLVGLRYRIKSLVCKHGFILDDVSISRLAAEDSEFELLPMEMEGNADKIKATVEERKSTVQKYRAQLLETLSRTQENLDDPRDQEELIIARRQRNAAYHYRPGVKERKKDYYQQHKDKILEYSRKYKKKRYLEKKQAAKGSED